MERIFSLNTEHFSSGYTKFGQFLQKGGLFTSALGITTFDSTYFGSVAATNNMTEIGAGTVTDDGIAGEVDLVATSNANAYIIGNAGHFYKVAYVDNTVTDLRSGTPITDPANGLAIFQPTGGTKYLYYWQKTQIGRWDLSGSHPTGWADNNLTGLTSTSYHKTHKFLRGVWYCNTDKIGSIVDDNAGGITHSTNSLDFPSTYWATDLTDDGFYLVAALNQAAGEGIFYGEPKVIFWNTFSSSWQREWRVPATSIYSIRSIGRVIYIICPEGIFVCTYDESPSLVWPLSAGGVGGGSKLLTANSSIIYKNGILFNHGTNVDGQGDILQYFGEVVPGQGVSYSTPINGVGEYLILKKYDYQFVVGDGNDNLFLASITTSEDGNVAATATAETKYIDLKGKWDIKRIDLLFAEPLAGNDAVNVDIQKEEDTAAVDWGTASNTLNGAKQRVSLRPTGTQGNSAEYLKIFLNITGGNPRIIGVTVWGDKRTE